MNYDYIQFLYRYNPLYTIHDYIRLLHCTEEQAKQVLLELNILPVVPVVETDEQKINYVTSNPKIADASDYADSLNTSASKLRYLFKKNGLVLTDYTLDIRDVRHLSVYRYVKACGSTIDVNHAMEYLDLGEETFMRGIENYNLYNYIGTDIENRIEIILTLQPNEYNAREIAERIGSDKQTVRDIVYKLGMFNNLRTNSKNGTTTDGERVETIVLKSNGYVYCVQEIADRLNFDVNYVKQLVIQEGLENMIAVRRSQSRIPISKEADEFMSFVEQYPNQYTYQQIANHFGKDVNLVREWIVNGELDEYVIQ